jgi:hypothetical protein
MGCRYALGNGHTGMQVSTNPQVQECKSARQTPYLAAQVDSAAVLGIPSVAVCFLTPHESVSACVLGAIGRVRWPRGARASGLMYRSVCKGTD